jgi:hypothetical protein
MIVRHFVHALGYRYRLHVVTMPGRNAEWLVGARICPGENFLADP